MKVLFFGTYDVEKHPRVEVLIEGLRDLGDDVQECNVPLGLTTEDRMKLLSRPWTLPRFGVRLSRVWWRLREKAHGLSPPEVVIVGYMAHFDVHLARRLWPETPIVLDHLASAEGTMRDRRLGSGVKGRGMRLVDRAAIGVADLVLVDTREHLALLPSPARRKAIVVRVGAPKRWFIELGRDPLPLKVVFFGLYTPLQGTLTIAEAIARLAGKPIRFTMVGRGQDYDRARAIAAHNRDVTWVDWIEGSDLPARVAAHHVCLGVFGTTPKAMRVVPNKVYQGAAAGCAIVTSGTRPQRRVLGSAGIYVAPGNAEGLADSLLELANDRVGLLNARRRSRSRAAQEFQPAAVVRSLRERLAQDVASAHCRRRT